MEHKEDILKKINSEDPDLQQEGLEEIKNNGDLSVVPELLDLVISDKNHDVTFAVVSLLADIKATDFKELLITRLKNTTDAFPKSLLLRICWESSLDYSEYAPLFARMVVEEEFIVALEAATILENMHKPGKEGKENILREFEKAGNSDERQFLIENIRNTWDTETPEEE